jgi:1-acyl-sn-glycerol-3-phosphate acyltransferase
MTNHTPSSRIWYQTARSVLCFADILSFRTRYSGCGNIPKEGGVLLVSNHQSHLDPPIIGLGCPRQLNALARKTLFDVPVLGRLIALLGSIPIDRDGMGLAGLREAMRCLKGGGVVLIFPEGTRSPDGKIAQFKPGFVSLAVRSRASILPCAIEGAHDCWPRGRKFPKPGRIRVHFGSPILPDEISRLDERELLVKVEDRVRQCHAHLLRISAETNV